MEDLLKELFEAGAILETAITEKVRNMDEATIKNIELINAVKIKVSTYADILAMRAICCNATLTYNIDNDIPIKNGRNFQIMLFGGGGTVAVHCPGWHNKKQPGWKRLEEIDLKDAKEIAKYLIKISENPKELKIELL